MPKRRKAATMPQEVCKCKDPKKLGMFVGTFFALMHLGWVIIVASGFGQMLYDWVLRMHMLQVAITVGPFDAWLSVMLIVFTFITGYIGGCIVALVWNYLGKCKCCLC